MKQLHAEMISRPLNGPLVIQIVYQIMSMATKWYFLAFYLKRLFKRYLSILSEKLKCCYGKQLV